MNICIGIVSYFPDSIREHRIIKFNNLIKKCSEIFPDINIIIIAQNWKNFNVPVNNCKIFNYDKLGIAGARNKLREWFINSEYDYLIMFDDDNVLKGDYESGLKLISMIENHPNGFGIFNWKRGQLWGFAISKSLFKIVNYPSKTAENGEIFEDTYLSQVCKYLYPNYVDLNKSGVWVGEEPGGKSTWWDWNKYNLRQMEINTDKLISEYKKDNMIYIIMCGGDMGDHPKQLSVVNGEVLVERTIRLLRENGINNIYISSSNPIFEQFGVPRIEYSKNNYLYCEGQYHNKNHWVNAYVPLNIPCTYLHGDVFYSPECIKTIVETETDDVAFFSTAFPLIPKYIKNHVEPLGTKVVNQDKFHWAVQECKRLKDEGKCWRPPISYDVWALIKGHNLDYDVFKKQTADVFGEGFVPIYDYSCDIDEPKKDIPKMNQLLKELGIEPWKG